MKYTVAEFVEAFATVLNAMAQTLDTTGEPWMLVGGIAVGVWCEPRATRDLDFAIATPSDPSKLASSLRGAGFSVDERELEAAAREGGPVRTRAVRSDAPPVVVDLLCVGTDFERAALARRRPARALNCEVSVATADDLVIYKLIAGRPQDLADVDRLLRCGAAPEDIDYVRCWAREWDIEAALDRALQLAAR
jgi:hypothetical protein